MFVDSPALRLSAVALCVLAATPVSAARAHKNRPHKAIRAPLGPHAPHGKKPHAPLRGRHRGKGAHEVTEEADTPPAPAAPLPPPPPLPTTYTGVVVLPLDNAGVDADIAAEVMSALTDQLEEMPGHQAVSPDDTRSALEGFHLSASDCDRDVPCVARLGAYARGQLVLETRVQAPAGTIMLSVRAIDTQKAVETHRVAMYLSQEQQTRLQQIQEVVVQIISPETYVGQLGIDCPDNGAEIYVDDQLLGYIPLAQPLSLAAGSHILRISKAGYQDINRFIDVAFNRLTTIKADLSDHTVVGAMVETHSATGFGGLYVLSSVAGLEVRIDGEPLGVTPMNAAYSRIAVGHHHLTLRKANSQPIAQDLDIVIDQRTDLQLEVTPDGMRLQVVDTVPTGQPLPTLESLAAARAAALAAAEALKPQPVDFPTWRLYTGAGIGLAGVGALVATIIIRQDIASYQSQANTLAQQSQQANITAAQLSSLSKQLASLNSKGASLNTWQDVTLYGGIGLLAVGAGMAMWDMWRVISAPATPVPQSTTSPAPGTAFVPAITTPPDPGVMLVPGITTNSIELHAVLPW